MELFGSKPKRKPHVEIIPMVDVMFLLLVFYILSSLALTKQAQIPVDLPNSSTAKKENATLHEDLVVTLKEEGEIYIQKRRVDSESFARVFREEAALVKGGLAWIQAGHLVIQGDKNVRWEEMTLVMDLLREQGVASYAFAVEKKTQ